MIKLLIKLAVVALIANATWRVGIGVHDALQVHRFRSADRRCSAGSRPTSELRARVFEIASDFDIPVTEEDVSLRTEDHHTMVDGSYMREIEVFPGYKYPWPFEFHIDTLSGDALAS